VIKVFSAERVPGVAQLAAYATTSYFLFDADGKDVPASAARLAGVAGLRRLGFRVFLAGGLTPENVHDAVATTRPFGVDVCRGVECAPGVKDPAALERFIAGVRS
jgi:phosphoribosylanthranilate isomerase